MSSRIRTLLLGGEYICPIAYAVEYDQLQSEPLRQSINEWLGEIDRRLARIGDDGAFFMAPSQLGVSENQKVREMLTRFRDVYEPAIKMLLMILQAKEGFTASPGDYVQLAELEQAVNETSTLELELRRLHGVISGVSQKHTNREFLKKMLEHLRSEGLLIISNQQSEVYQVTGKIDHLHSILGFIEENALRLEEPDSPSGQEPDMIDSLG